MSNRTLSLQQAKWIDRVAYLGTVAFYFLFVILLTSLVTVGWHALLWMVLVGWLPILAVNLLLDWVHGHVDPEK